MVPLQPGVAHGPLRLEPDQETHSRLADCPSHGREALREARRIRMRVSLPPGEAALVPSGVQPVGVDG